MCTEAEIRKVVRKELDDNLFKFKEEIFAHTSKILSHQQTAPETNKELTNIKKTCSDRGIELALMHQIQMEQNKILDAQKEQLDKMQKEQRENFGMIQREQRENFDKLSEKLDKKYSGKWVENTFKALLFLIGGALVYAFLKKLGLEF